MLWPCFSVAQEVYVLQRPNDYVSIEGIVEVKGVSYARPEAAVVIDANNDGLEDLLMGPSNWSVEPELSLAIFVNQGGGKFVEDAAGVIDNVPLVGFLNHPTIVADFNGDGADDAFLVDQGLELGEPPFDGNQPKLLLSNGAGGLINASNTHLPPLETEFHHSASVGDIDGDSDLDILVVTLSEARVYILDNDGSGDFSLRTQGLPQDLISEEANQDIGALTLAYVNDDSLLDMVFGWYHNAPQIQTAVLLQDETGNFNETQRLSDFSEKFEGGGIDLILANDLDSDGDDDLIGKIDESTLPGVEGEGKLAWFALRNDNGVYVDVTKTWLGSSIISDLVPNANIAGLYLQDINGDEHADLLFAHSGIRLDQLNHYLLLNDGTGKFSPAGNAAVNSTDSVGPLWYTDHDQDGDIDIVAMLPDVNQVGQDYVQSGYELVVLEKTDTPLNVLFEVNAGHAGAWYNPDTSGQGQLIDIEPESGFMFLAWFAYTDATSGNPNEQHWLTAQGTYDGNTAILPVYETLGGQFDDPAEVDPPVLVGSIELTFEDCTSGQASYSIDSWGVTGSFPLSRVIPGSENVCLVSSRAASAETITQNDVWDGAWFNSDTSGQGFLIDSLSNPEGDDFIFVAWFTYGDTNASGQRWLTAQGPLTGNQAEITVYEITGGSFDDPTPVNPPDVIGSMTIEFMDCNTAQLSYDLTDDGLSGSMDIVRVIPGTEALCESLVGSK
jgi:hypothetical protein